MVAAQEFAWWEWVQRTLRGNEPRPVLVLVEGAAGMGKTHLLAEIGGLPELAETGRVSVRCGLGESPEEMRRDGPTLLLVDDLHRASARERAWLKGLLEQPVPGLAAVLAYRPEELAIPGLPLGAHTDYSADLNIFEHQLEAWREGRVRRAAVEALGDRCTDDAVVRLHELSGGVPQVVTALLKAMNDGTPGICMAPDVEEADVPVRLAELFLGRTAALPPMCRPIVWAAAVVGEPMSQEELIATSGLGDAQGRQALLVALAGAALAELEEDRYGFPVPLAARAVRTSVPGPVRDELHERAATVLTRRQPVPWAAAADHRRNAGLIHSWLRAAEAAARAAAGSGHHQDAISLLEQTLASPWVPPHTRTRLALLLARSAVVGLRADQTVDVLTQAVQDEALTASVRGELRLDLGLMLCNQVGDLSRGRRELEIAATELHEVRPDLAARAMAALALPYWPGPSIDAHEGWLRRATALADASGEDAVRAAAAANRASFAMSCGNRGSWGLVTALPTESADPGSRQHAARGMCNAADAAAWLGFYRRADHILVEGLDLSTRSDAPYTESTASGTRLLLEWWTGQWTDLAQRCEAFVAATAGMPLVSSDARLVRGLLAFAQNDWATALSWLSEENASAPENTPSPVAAAKAGALIRLALIRGDLSAAAEQAAAAWSDVAEKGVWVWAAELAPWAVEATARGGDLATAQGMVHGFARGIAERDAPAARAALVWSRAVLAEVDQDLPRAAELYRSAAEIYGAQARPYSRALTAEAAARCVLTVSAAESSGEAAVRDIAELESCARLFGDLGAAWDAARSRALLRTYQPAGEAHTSVGPGQLTPREVDVADLAARGLSNREIATALHLSPRTVEQHIARAMQKTGAHSRRGLAHHRP